MEKADAEKIITLVVEVSAGHTAMSPALKVEWRTVLEPMSYREAKLALKKHFRDSQWAPSPWGFEKLVDGLTSPHDPTDVAWGQAVEIMAAWNYGTANNTNAKPLVYAAINALNLRTDSRDAQQAFTRTYERLVEEDHDKRRAANSGSAGAAGVEGQGS